MSYKFELYVYSYGINSYHWASNQSLANCKGNELDSIYRILYLMHVQHCQFGQQSDLCKKSGQEVIILQRPTKRKSKHFACMEPIMIIIVRIWCEQLLYICRYKWCKGKQDSCHWTAASHQVNISLHCNESTFIRCWSEYHIFKL